MGNWKIVSGNDAGVDTFIGDAPAVLSTEVTLGKNVFERSDGTKVERWRVRANWQENTAAENYEYHWYTNLYVQWSGGAVVRLASEHPNGVRPFFTDWFEVGAPDTGTFFFRPVNKAGVESAAQGHTSIYVSPMPAALALLSPSGSIKYGVFTDEQGNKTLKYRPEMSWTLNTGHADFNYHYYVLVRFQPMSGGTPVGSPIVLGGFHPTDVAETDWFPIGSPVTYRLEYVPVNRLGILGTPQIAGTFDITTMPDAPAVINLDGGFEYSVFQTDEGDKMRYRVWADWDLNTGHPNHQYHYYVRMELVPVDSGGSPTGSPILVAGVHPDEPLPWKTDYFDIGAPQKYRLQVRAVNRLEEGGATQTITTEDVDGMPGAPNVTSPSAEVVYQVTDTPSGRKAWYGFRTSWVNGTGDWLDRIEPTYVYGSDVVPLGKEVEGPPTGKKYFHGWFELAPGTEISGVSIEFRCFNRENEQTSSPATVSGLSLSYTAARTLTEPSLEEQFLGQGLTHTGTKIIGANTNTSNLLANPTFESDQQLAHWDPNSPSLAIWTNNPALIQSGSGAVLMFPGATLIHSDRITCKPGESFVGRAWALNYAGTADGSLRVILGFMNSAYTYIGHQEASILASASGWTQSAAIVATAPANAAYVYLQFIVESTTGFWSVDTAALRMQTDADTLANGAVSSLAKFGPEQRPTTMWYGGSLPSNGTADPDYPAGHTLIWLTSGAKMYKRTTFHTWDQVLKPEDMAIGTLAVGVAYAGTIYTTQIGSGALPVGVVYTSTINASQVNAGLFSGHSLLLNANGITTNLTNGFDSSTGYAGLIMTENSTGRKAVFRPGFIDLFTNSGVRTAFMGAGDMSLYYPVNGTRKITLSAIGGSPAVTLFDAGGSFFSGYTGNIPATATLQVMAGWIVGYF